MPVESHNDGLSLAIRYYFTLSLATAFKNPENARRRCAKGAASTRCLRQTFT
jgi:hypothetical protein